MAHLAAPSMLRICTAGSVDDGKSTLIGRLLYEANAVFDDQLAAIEKSKRIHGQLDLSLLTDGLKSEREQGITIDVAYKYFSSSKRKYILADAPGHLQYTRNMVTAASLADVMILLIDARHGILEQSRRHAYLAHCLGVKHLIVAINKIDLVHYDADRIQKIELEFRQLEWTQSARSLYVIPLSALDGDNISRNSEKTPWYKGPSLLDLMDGLDAQLDETGDFCLNVQCILRNSSGRRWAAGTIAHGQIQVDEPIKILASGQTSRVREILLAGLPAQKAKAGDAVALALYDERDLDRGSLLHKPDRKLSASQAWQAQIVWFDDEAWHPEERYILRLGTQTTRVQISSILHRFNLETLKPEAASDLHLNDIALVQLESTQALYALPYHESRIFGAFILIDPRTYRTVAAGMIAQLGAQQGLRSNRLHDTKRGSPEWEDAAQDPRHLRLPLSFLQDNSVGTQMRAIEDLLEQGWHICLETSDEAMHIKTRLATKGLGTFKDGLGI